jgi:hypothetical protein
MFFDMCEAKFGKEIPTDIVKITRKNHRIENLFKNENISSFLQSIISIISEKTSVVLARKLINQGPSTQREYFITSHHNGIVENTNHFTILSFVK